MPDPMLVRGPAPSERMAPASRGVTRRNFGAIAGGAFASLVLGMACDASGRQADARIPARPRSGVTTSGRGSRALGLGATRDAWLHLPDRRDDPLPLLVLLHGAGGSGAGMLRRLGAFADSAGVAVLSPDSRDDTWDGVRGSFGPDVRFISRALERAFETVSVDPARLSIGGFSDGASYAISVGLQNGDLFRRVLAYSPGFFVDGPARGKPAFFISHGTDDRILPIDRCSRLIVPALQRHGYDVTFHPFTGGHDIPPTIAEAGMRWVAAG